MDRASVLFAVAHFAWVAGNDAGGVALYADSYRPVALPTSSGGWG